MNGDTRASAQRRVALVMWARSAIDEMASRRAWGEVVITIEDGAVTYVRTTEGKKPPPSLTALTGHSV